MKFEEILTKLNDLGNQLNDKFGTESYIERCTLHDIKEEIKSMYTMEEIRNYITSQDSFGDVIYNLRSNKINEANEINEDEDE
jgi:S-adenosylmethionine hydrolase